MEVFVHADEYDFANVKQCDNKANIIYCLKLKFADIIATDMNAVQ